MKSHRKQSAESRRRSAEKQRAKWRAKNKLSERTRAWAKMIVEVNGGKR